MTESAVNEPAKRLNDSRVNTAELRSRVVLKDTDIDRALTRIAHEILEANHGPENLILLGIPRRGYPLAVRLATKISAAETGFDPVRSVGQLDVTMFRDDLSRQPTRAPQRTSIPSGGIDNKTVVLVDDVLYSGRTIRAALDAIVDLGRPTAIRLAVLIDRGHRELPIRADHVGKNLPTSSAERVHVNLAETDNGSEHVTISATSVTSPDVSELGNPQSGSPQSGSPESSSSESSRGKQR